MFRIHQENLKENAKVVFIQHGLFNDADVWVVHKNESLAFVLANQGHDIWLGNNRGNKYSRNHTKLDPDVNNTEFFDYSFFELGRFDAPAQIDYVRNYTGHDKLYYVGHSQGTS